ncbi:hypothetical protein DAI22_05g080001 [Oryza sativa Japonica Group]|nr:hypothetical protein DAI22_05g080001 [Oryza sativa Japonica Group]
MGEGGHGDSGFPGAAAPDAPTSMLPALLLTPPRSQMLPLLPTPCLIILHASFRVWPASDPKPGRADAVERWDADKKAGTRTSATPTHANAEAVQRWDSNKRPLSRASSAELGHERRQREEQLHKPNDDDGEVAAGAAAGPAFFTSRDPSMLPCPPSC